MFKPKMLVMLVILIPIITVGCQPPALGDTGPGVGGGITTPVHVIGAVVNSGGIAQAQVMIDNSGTAINGATVKVNGNTCTELSPGMYMGAIASITAGTSVVLTIVATGVNISTSLTMPTAAVITAPAAGSYPASAPLLVSWDALTTAPDQIQVNVDQYTASGFPFSAMLLGSDTNYTIQADTLASGQSTILIKVVTLHLATLSGASYLANSVYAVGNISPVSISTP